MQTELKNILSGNGVSFLKDVIGCVSLVVILFAGLHIFLINFQMTKDQFLFIRMQVIG